MPYRDWLCQTAGIWEVRLCTDEEVEEHAQYLACDVNARGYARGLLLGSLELRTGVVTSLERLGSLHTIWSQIGSLWSADLYRQPKFAVRQALHVFRQSDSPDDAKRIEKIECFRGFDRAGALRNRITVSCLDNGSAMIVDGNHTAVAIYTARVKDPGGDGMRLQVYVIARHH